MTEMHAIIVLYHRAEDYGRIWVWLRTWDTDTTSRPGFHSLLASHKITDRSLVCFHAEL